ncbi:hypothetical protein MPC4_300033 [Methylocella tundrae]|uniref:Uncharacterized protein n=1 Tax=Methylocella tundrae TaxID=227605 RepID=A0A8B6M7V5_METTU|nr:hypothetical protein MPC1_860007 [Methylocella tundrae]VTZ51113.1 hypothetical protein MPC4_300033 [Methylocella tundrae]
MSAGKIDDDLKQIGNCFSAFDNAAADRPLQPERPGALAHRNNAATLGLSAGLAIADGSPGRAAVNPVADAPPPAA